MRFASGSVRRPIGFRPPSDQIPSAVQSDSVRRPIGFRPPPDRIPSAVQSDSVRRPVGFRPLPDENISRSMGKNVAEVSGLRSTKSNTNSVKTVIKTAPSVILSDTAQRRLSAKSLRNPIWHAICISVSENINQLK